MKVCLLVMEYPPNPVGGIGAFAMELSRGLSETGWTPSIPPIRSGLTFPLEKAKSYQFSNMPHPKKDMPFDDTTLTLSLMVDGLGIENVNDAAHYIARFLDYEQLSEKIQIQSYLSEVKKRAKRIASTVFYFNCPRPWEVAR